MKNFSLSLYIVVLVISSCTTGDIQDIDPTETLLENQLMNIAPNGRLDYFQLPNESDLSSIPQDPKNPLSISKVNLGKFLFYETAIAKRPAKDENKESWSCASCHVPSSSFVPGRIQGIADGGMGFGRYGEERLMNPIYKEDEIDVQGLRPLSLLNAAYVTNALWNGGQGAGFVNIGTEANWDEEELTLFNHTGFMGIETQSIAGIDVHRMEMNEDIAEEYGYKDMFDNAFPEREEGDRYSRESAGLAIAAYIRTLLPNQAPFQKWLKGDENALSPQQKRGAMVFFGKGNCYQCHKGPGLNSTEFYAIGVNDLHMTGGLQTGPDDRKNLGRGGFTKNADEMFAFKVPQLYNLKHYRFYFHGSSKRDLHEVVDYFNDATPENPNVPESSITPLLRPLGLTQPEKDDLVEFLKYGLEDKNLTRYVPDNLPSGHCFPNNDQISRVDLGCN